MTVQVDVTVQADVTVQTNVTLQADTTEQANTTVHTDTNLIRARIWSTGQPTHSGTRERRTNIYIYI